MMMTLVWIDGREALVVRRSGGATHCERIASDLPVHHRATGHVRHDPLVRHGGGMKQTAIEQQRQEHLARFLDAVATRLTRDENLLLIGPGTVREHLARQIARLDHGQRAPRDVRCEAAPPMTRRQLVALLRRVSGDEPRRQMVGPSGGPHRA
jgi:hypothetical protein